MTDERDFLAAARRGLSPTEADHERVRRATAAALAAGATGPTVGDTTSSRALPWASRIVVVGVVAAVAAGIGYRAGRRAGREEATPERRPPVATGPAAPSPSMGFASDPRPSPTPTAPPVDGQAVRTAPHRRVVADAAVIPAPPVTPAASLAEEVRALRAVERALRDGNSGFALALLRELDRAVPNGQLVEERLATRIIARCTAGEIPMGVNLADDFASQYPGSVYGRRVADACARTDSSRSGDSAVRRPPHDEN